jgi:hypothetical protein
MAVQAARAAKATAVRRRPPRLSVAEVMGFSFVDIRFSGSFERVTIFATLVNRVTVHPRRLKARATH